MKIKFIGFSVTEYGDPPYPSRFAEQLRMLQPQAIVEYTALGGLSIDSLPCLLHKAIPLCGYDLIVMEIATSWWSLLHENDEDGTQRRMAMVFKALDESQTPYCFLNLYRRDIDDNDVLVRAMRKEAGSQIPIIDIKSNYRKQLRTTGKDDTTDGIHPNTKMINAIANELMSRLLAVSNECVLPPNWAAWRRSIIARSDLFLPNLVTAEPDVALPTYTFESRHGVTLTGYVVEQGWSVQFYFAQPVILTGLFFTYGPDTNYLEVKYDDLRLEVPMHDEMSFYRRLGYREFSPRSVTSVILIHPSEERRKPLQRDPWEKTTGLRNFILGFSCFPDAKLSSRQSSQDYADSQNIFFYGASVTQQSKGSGYVDMLKAMHFDAPFAINSLGIGGCHFNDAGYFNAEYVLKAHPSICVLEWNTTGLDWFDNRKMASVLAAFASAGCLPCFLVLPSKANTERDRRAEAQVGDWASTYGVPHLDIRHAVNMNGILRDDVHTTVEGAQRYANIIAPWLRDLISRHQHKEFADLLVRLADLSEPKLPVTYVWSDAQNYHNELCLSLQRVGTGPVSIAISTTVGVHSPVVEVVLEGGGKHHEYIVSIWDRWSYYDRDLIRVLVDSKGDLQADVRLELSIRIRAQNPEHQTCVRHGIDFNSPKWFNVKAFHIEGAILLAGPKGVSALPTEPSQEQPVQQQPVQQQPVQQQGASNISIDPNAISNSFYLVHGQSEGYLDIRNVSLISSSGILLDEFGQVIKTAVDEHLFWIPKTMPRYGYTEDFKRFKETVIEERLSFLEYHAHELKAIAQRSGNTVRLQDDALYVDLTHPFGWYAFGHLHDSLQRLYSIRDLLLSPKRYDLKFLISNPHRIIDFKDHLHALTGYIVDDSHIIEAKKENVYIVNHCIKPAMPSVYTNFTASVFDWLYAQYASYFQKSDYKRYRLYLSRNNVSQGRRGVLNEGEIIPLLLDAEFIVVNGNESLAQIYALFSQAEVILGAHGSLFANTIFCNSDCRIIEYCAHNRIDHSFRRKRKKATSYEHKIVQGDNNFNIQIPLNEIQYLAESIREFGKLC